LKGVTVKAASVVKQAIVGKTAVSITSAGCALIVVKTLSLKKFLPESCMKIKKIIVK
jgi:hypothetical protein